MQLIAWVTSVEGQKIIGEYKKELLKTLKELEDHLYTFRIMLDIKTEHKDSLLSALNQEIDYCTFYFEYSKRLKKGELNKWKFTKTEDRDCDPWTNKGDCWEYMTGKVKAIIEISKNKASTKITLKLKNDSKSLEFLGSWKTTDMRYTNVRSEEGKEKTILFNYSGHGLMDLAGYQAYFAGELENYPLPPEVMERSIAVMEGLPKPD